MYMSHSWGFHLNQQRSLRAAHYPLISTKINSIIPMFFPNISPNIYTGWWYTYPSEKYESQMEVLFPTLYGKMNMFQTTNQYSII